jgi:oligosaccharide repeat unit polymerase
MTAIPALALVALAILARKIEGSWLAPGAFFAGFWAIFVAAVQIFASDMPEYVAGLWWIVLGALALALGSWVGLRLRAANQGHGANPLPPLPGLARTTAVMSGIGLVAPWSLLASRGESPSVFLSLDSLARVGRDFSVARYLEGYQEPIPVRIGLMAVYGAALMGGLLLGQRDLPRRRRLTGLLPIVPAAGVTLVQTTKSDLYITLILIGSSFLTTRVRASRLSWKALIPLSLVLVILIPTSIAVSLNRYGFSAANSVQVNEVTYRTEVTAFGSLPAFTYWFDHMSPSTQLTWGTSSFFGPSSYLPGNTRVNGVYTDFVSLGYGATTNVYTIYRGLIEDFSLPGALLAMFVLGLASRIAYVRVKAGHLPAAGLLSAFYAITAWSFVINLFGYDTIIGGLLVFLAYSFSAHRSRHSRKQFALVAGAS